MTGARVLFVVPYPPPFDARTRAAVDHVRALRAVGEHVEVLSPEPSGAHHHEAVRAWSSVPRLVRRFRTADRVVVDDALLAAAPLRVALRAARAVDRWRPPLVSSSDTVAEAPEVWPSDRDAAMAEIRARAGSSRTAAPSSGEGEPGSRLRRVAPLSLPEPTSTRPGASTVQRLVRRLTRWQIDPIVARVNHLRATLVEEFETLERRDGR
jgi:hypothetical protein